MRAYLRDDLLEERRALMQAWADYVLPPSAPAEQVIGEIEADGLTPPSSGTTCRQQNPVALDGTRRGIRGAIGRAILSEWAREP